MPISKGGDGSLVFTTKQDNFLFNKYGVHQAGQLAICDDKSPIAITYFDCSGIASNAKVKLVMANPTPNSEVVITFPTSSGGLGGPAFSIIQPDAGTSPTASSSAFTLTLTSTDNSLIITGNSTTDTIALTAGTNMALLGGRAGGQTLNGGTAASNNLTLMSTANATKGKIFIGSNSYYDEANIKLGIGTTSIDPSAAMQITSTTGGFMPPQLTDAQRNAITTTTNGILIWNVDNQRFEYSTGNSWAALT